MQLTVVIRTQTRLYGGFMPREHLEAGLIDLVGDMVIIVQGKIQLLCDGQIEAYRPPMDVNDCPLSHHSPRVNRVNSLGTRRRDVWVQILVTRRRDVWLGVGNIGDVDEDIVWGEVIIIVDCERGTGSIITKSNVVSFAGDEANIAFGKGTNG